MCSQEIPTRRFCFMLGSSQRLSSWRNACMSSCGCRLTGCRTILPHCIFPEKLRRTTRVSKSICPTIKAVCWSHAADRHPYSLGTSHRVTVLQRISKFCLLSYSTRIDIQIDFGLHLAECFFCGVGRKIVKFNICYLDSMKPTKISMPFGRSLTALFPNASY